MIIIIPIIFHAGSTSSKANHMSKAVKIGLTLLNTFARVTPIWRTVAVR